MMGLWTCPKCGYTEDQPMAQEVSHPCPKERGKAVALHLVGDAR